VTSVADPAPKLEIAPLTAAHDAEWDALAGASETSGFMQSTAWAAFKRAEGYQTQRYCLHRDGHLIGGATVLYYGGGGAFLLCPDGPVLPWEDTATTRAGLRLLLEATRCDFPDTIGLRIEPRLPPGRQSVLQNWQRAPIDLLPQHTRFIDLTDEIPAMRAAMRPKGRYNLGLAERHGVTIRRSQEMADLNPFYTLFAETARRQSFFAEPYGFFLNLGAALLPERQATLYFAEWQGERLAAVLALFYGRRATYLYGGSSLAHRNVMPCYPLHAAVMVDARHRGCQEYDLYGIDPFEHPDHPYAGISTFKRQFGGRVVSYRGAQDHLFYDRLAERIAGRLGQDRVAGAAK